MPLSPPQQVLIQNIQSYINDYEQTLQYWCQSEPSCHLPVEGTAEGQGNVVILGME